MADLVALMKTHALEDAQAKNWGAVAQRLNAIARPVDMRRT